jgi:hypothetical protein
MMETDQILVKGFYSKLMQLVSKNVISPLLITAN